MNKFPYLQRIETPRVELSPLDARHAAALSAMTNDPRITSAVSFLPSPFTVADAERLLRRNAQRRDCFLGAWTPAGDLVGVVGVHKRGQHELELGYWIGVAHQNQGYATEAVRAVVAQLRRAMRGHALVAECKRENAASWRVLEKLGFVPTGQITNGDRERLRFEEVRPA